MKLYTFETPVFIVNKDCVVTFANEAALMAMGLNRMDVVGKMTCTDLSETPLHGVLDSILVVEN
jgi:hypothetical protein